MKTTSHTSIPDHASVPTELRMGSAWDAKAVSDLIRSKCRFGETPTFLFLGRKETALLRRHLAAVFGSDAVTTLHDTYYMGLEVMEIACESFLSAAGRKTIRTLQDPTSRRPGRLDLETEAIWRLRM